jgi:hypothetical protein
MLSPALFRRENDGAGSARLRGAATPSIGASCRTSGRPAYGRPSPVRYLGRGSRRGSKWSVGSAKPVSRRRPPSGARLGLLSTTACLYTSRSIPNIGASIGLAPRSLPVSGNSTSASASSDPTSHPQSPLWPCFSDFALNRSESPRSPPASGSERPEPNALTGSGSSVSASAPQPAVSPPSSLRLLHPDALLLLPRLPLIRRPLRSDRPPVPAGLHIPRAPRQTDGQLTGKQRACFGAFSFWGGVQQSSSVPAGESRPEMSPPSNLTSHRVDATSDSDDQGALAAPTATPAVAAGHAPVSAPAATAAAAAAAGGDAPLEASTGAETLLLAAVRAGADVCFANPGTTEMWMVSALDRLWPAVRPVLCLHENVATGAADGERLPDETSESIGGVWCLHAWEAGLSPRARGPP